MSANGQTRFERRLAERQAAKPVATEWRVVFRTSSGGTRAVKEDEVFDDEGEATEALAAWVQRLGGRRCLLERREVTAWRVAA